jgi:O-antigen/teichoic acid export membrane protein
MRASLTPALARHGVFLTVSQILQVAVAFGANLVLVRYLLPADFGRFAVALAGIGLVFSLLCCRINILIIRASDDALAAAKDRYFTILAVETALAASVAGGWVLLTAGTSPWDLSLVAIVAVRHWVQQDKAFFERAMPYRTLASAEAGIAALAHLCAVALVVAGIGPAVLYIREGVLTVAELAALWSVGGLTLGRLRPVGIAGLLAIYREAAGNWVDGVLENGYQRLVILAAGLFGGAVAAGLFFQAYRLAIVPHQLLAPVMTRLAANWISRSDDPAERIARRQRIVGVFFIPLLLAGVATFLWADPLVPWLFGAPWSRAADLLAAMAGMVTFFTLFETLRAYCIVVRRMGLFLIGRAVQYAGVLSALGAAGAGWLAGDMALAIGQSLAFFLAFLFVAAMLRYREATVTARWVG